MGKNKLEHEARLIIQNRHFSNKQIIIYIYIYWN
ncbi:MAG: hypothetical protein ACJA2M_001960 [Polaribacter sp.]|jgi:hypothetical protein